MKHRANNNIVYRIWWHAASHVEYYYLRFHLQRHSKMTQEKDFTLRLWWYWKLRMNVWQRAQLRMWHHFGITRYSVHVSLSDRCNALITPHTNLISMYDVCTVRIACDVWRMSRADAILMRGALDTFSKPSHFSKHPHTHTCISNIEI